MVKTKCNICGKVLSNSNKLVEHIKREHSNLSERSIMYLQSVGVNIDSEKVKKIIGKIKK